MGHVGELRNLPLEMGIPLLQEFITAPVQPKVGETPPKNAFFSNQKFHSTTEEMSFFFFLGGGVGKTKKELPGVGC